MSDFFRVVRVSPHSALSPLWLDAIGRVYTRHGKGSMSDKSLMEIVHAPNNPHFKPGANRSDRSITFYPAAVEKVDTSTAMAVPLWRYTNRAGTDVTWSMTKWDPPTPPTEYRALPVAIFDALIIERDSLRERCDRAEKTMAHIKAILGPVTCNECQGCNAEMAMAVEEIDAFRKGVR